MLDKAKEFGEQIKDKLNQGSVYLILLARFANKETFTKEDLIDNDVLNIKDKFDTEEEFKNYVNNFLETNDRIIVKDNIYKFKK